jgi:phenylacetate-CoA ligase
MNKFKSLLFRISLKLIRKDIFKEYYRFKSLEYNSLENNLKFQKEKLKDILLYSWKNVPYYTKILEKSGTVIDGKINLNNYSKIPILTKEIIRKEFENLKSNEINKMEWYYNTSGGSTGKPIKLIQDNKKWTEDMAMAWLQNSFICDYPCKMIKLWGSERDILGSGTGILGKIKNWLEDYKILNTFKMTEKDMKNYVKKINEYKPEMIEAYVQSIYEFAKFIEKNNLEIYSPKGIITSAGTLNKDVKSLIEKVFRTKVYNRYGSRETSALACSCEKNQELHENIFTRYIEVLDKNLTPCKPGKIGEVYVTMLNNHSMPLIRYKIGDMAIPSKIKICACGRGMPLLHNIVGRTNSMIKTPEGVFDSVAIETLLYFYKPGIPFSSFSKYRIIQETKTKLILKVVIINHKNWPSEKKEIIKKFKKVLGNRTKLFIKGVKEINPTKSGKYAYIVSKVK